MKKKILQAFFRPIRWIMTFLKSFRFDSKRFRKELEFSRKILKIFNDLNWRQFWKSFKSHFETQNKTAFISINNNRIRSYLILGLEVWFKAFSKLAPIQALFTNSHARKSGIVSSSVIPYPAVKMRRFPAVLIKFTVGP